MGFKSKARQLNLLMGRKIVKRMSFRGLEEGWKEKKVIDFFDSFFFFNIYHKNNIKNFLKLSIITSALRTLVNMTI